MSVNYGETVSNPVTLTPSPKTMTLSGLTHGITATSNQAVNVAASFGSMALSKLNAQISENTIVQPGFGSMTLTGQVTSVDFVPVQGDVTVDASTDSMTLTGLGTFTSSSGPLETDWTARISGPGVFVTENFNYADSSAMRAAQDGGTHVPGQSEALLGNIGLSANGKCLHIKTYDTAGPNGGAWRREWTPTNGLYIQHAFRMDENAAAWAPEHGLTELKLANYTPFGNGQVVLSYKLNIGFPTFLTNGAGGPVRYIDGTNLSWRNYDRAMQNTIDNLSPAYPLANETETLQRHGPAERAIREHGDNYSYLSSAATGGDYTQNLLTRRGFTYPDPNAEAAGGVGYHYDNWYTVTVFIENDGSAGPFGQDILMMWLAKYGEAPTLMFDTRLPFPATSEYSTPGGAWSLSDAQSTYGQCEFLNYDTPRGSNVGYRPILNTYFDELICSTEPIPFPNPGGTPFYLPQAPSVLSNAAAALDFGEDSLVSTSFSTSVGNNYLNWICNFHYDPVRRKSWFMAQIAATSAPKHYEYDEDTNIWTGGSTVGLGPNQHTHVYDNPTYDHVTGTRYYIEGANSDTVWKWDIGDNLLTGWTESARSASLDIPSILANDTEFWDTSEGASEWHPNLFGANQGGLVIVCRRGVGAYNPRTDIYSVIIPNTTWTSGIDTPAALYCRGLDAVFVWNRQNDQTFKITDSTTYSPLTWPSNVAAGIGPDPTGGGNAKPVDDPAEGATFYCLEDNATRRVWKYNSGADTYDLQSFSHPFQSSDAGSPEDFQIAAMYDHKTIMAIERTTSGDFARMRVWRPNS